MVVERLVTRRRRETSVTPCHLTPSQLLSYDASMSHGHRCYVTAALDHTDLLTVFVVGDNRTCKGFRNVPLQKDQQYKIWFGVVIVVDGETAVAFAPTKQPVIGKYTLTSICLST